MQRNLLTEQQEQINEAIKLLDACIHGIVLNDDKEKLTQTEIIETVIEMLKGNVQHYTEKVT